MLSSQNDIHHLSLAPTVPSWVTSVKQGWGWSSSWGSPVIQWAHVWDLSPGPSPAPPPLAWLCSPGLAWSLGSWVPGISAFGCHPAGRERGWGWRGISEGTDPFWYLLGFAALRILEFNLSWGVWVLEWRVSQALMGGVLLRHSQCVSHSVVSNSFGTPMDCSPAGSSVPGILWARVLQWVAIPSSRGIFSIHPRDRTWVSCTAGRFFTIWATRSPPDISGETSTAGWGRGVAGGTSCHTCTVTSSVLWPLGPERRWTRTLSPLGLSSQPSEVCRAATHRLILLPLRGGKWGQWAAYKRFAETIELGPGACFPYPELSILSTIW